MSRQLLLIFLLIFSTFFIIVESTDYQMIISYGNPNVAGLGTGLIYNDMTWKDCVKTCYNDDRCVLAFSRNITLTDCINYRFNDVKSVNLYSWEKGRGSVAVKGNDTTCSGSMIGNFPISISTPLGKYIVSVTQESGNNFQMPGESTSTYKSWLMTLDYYCPDNWISFNRTNGTYCKFMTSANFSKEEAVSYCFEMFNATLANFESVEEINQTLDYVEMNGISRAQYWTDGVRTERCSATPTTCQDFTWENLAGSNATTILENSWVDKQPSGLSYSVAENCLSVGKLASLGFNDIACNFTVYVLCGKLIHP